MENQERWTCQACGCNTNSAEETSCSVCGTSNSGPNHILRRGSSALRSASWFARSLRGFGGEDMDPDHEFWEAVEEAEDIDIFAQIPGLRNRLRLEGINISSSVNPTELWRKATENAVSYQPRWAQPSQLVRRSNRTYPIEVGDGERQNLAHLPNGTEEGRAIRAEEPFPRHEGFGMPSNSANSTRQSKIFGFRVAFEHPTVEPGAGMGGCYLVGVTTQSFSQYSERNALQQSPLFWGIADNGKKFEGPLFANPGVGNEGSFGESISPDEAPFNDHDVLFGSREVVTVICDLESRSLTFWRNETLLGTLVTTLPRTGTLYPVVVPYNCGVTVAITGMNSDPLPLLQTLATDWRQEKIEAEARKRAKLEAHRSKLIQNGSATEATIDAMKRIFSKYTAPPSTARRISMTSTISCTAAARLWYRADMKLSHLDSLVENSKTGDLSFQTFMDIINQVAAEDEAIYKELLARDEPDEKVQVGDKVELCDGYLSLGDASSGPLRPGDRGVVQEIQEGSDGERTSVRVYFNGRRWWYHPRAIVSERSRLIDSPGIWFLRRLLRSHGLDPSTLENMSGKQVTQDSYEIGDMVLAKSNGARSRVMKQSFGRIVIEPSSGNDASQSTETALVQMCSPNFAKAVGTNLAGTTLTKRRVELAKLVHTGWLEEDDFDESNASGSDAVRDEMASPERRISADLNGLGRLDRVSMDNILKESRKSHSALANLIAHGLQAAVEKAMDSIEKQLLSKDPREDLADRIDSLGYLVQCIVTKLFDPDNVQEDIEREEAAPSQSQAELARRERLSRHNIISLIRERRAGNLRDSDLHDFPFGAGSLSVVRNASSFLFNRERLNDDPNLETEDVFGSSEDQSFFDKLLLGRTLVKGQDLPSTLSNASFVSSVVKNGFLNNSSTWVRSFLESQSRQSSSLAPSNSSGASAVSKMVDFENGKLPLLRMAVLLGCPVSIIRALISHGCTVTSEIIEKAAYTNQAHLLGELLKHVTWRDNIVDLERCSEDAKKVLEKCKEQHDILAKKMAESSGSFMSTVLRKMVQLCCVSRSISATNKGQSRSTLTEIVIGNTMIKAMQESQEIAMQSSTTQTTSSNQTTDRSGRFPVTSKSINSGMNPRGLLGSLPVDVVKEAVISDEGGFQNLMNLCEGMLYGKDQSSIVSGIQILTTAVEAFPELLNSEDFSKYGFHKLIEFHRRLASRRKYKICTSKDMRKYLGNAESSKDPLVRCPRGHPATMHITRHSSFRCDLCGSGVERGCPMHGCRECDWDACEDCTDELEAGLVKCSAVERLAETYIALQKLKQAAQKETAEKMTIDVDDLSHKIKTRDIDAAKSLVAAINQPGMISTYDFYTQILPALHEALSSDDSNEEATIKAGRKVKKAKREEDIGSFVEESKDFAREIALSIAGFGEASKSDTEKAEHSGASISVPRSQNPRETKLIQLVGSSELLRRLQLVLSLHENMTLEPHVPRALFKSPDSGSELHLLTKPMNVELENTLVVGSAGKQRIRAEPLVSVSDIVDEILQHPRVPNSSYVEYCKSLADDSAILALKVKADEPYWSIARVCFYDASSGLHDLQYCNLDGYDSKLSLVDGQTLNFENVRSKVSLATKEYLILIRSQDSKPRTRSRHENREPEASQRGPRRYLKRSWSALALIDAQKPVNVAIQDEVDFKSANTDDGDMVHFHCQEKDRIVVVEANKESIEKAPVFHVHFLDSDMNRIRIDQASSLTLVALLGKMKGSVEGLGCLSSDENIKVPYTLDYLALEGKKLKSNSKSPGDGSPASLISGRVRKIRDRAWSNDCMDDEVEDPESEMKSVSILCMEVISAIVEAAEDETLPRESDYDAKYVSNLHLSRKLLANLDDPVTVVGRALPSWCFDGPSFTPRLFSYDARKALLQKSAFGVSRSVLKQQEAIINVGRLRQRMAALRARAVELVGEAFSGGAEDPTALQLQADELYGMEEALGARVRAEFRKARWQEFSLEVLKAAVRRDHLIEDAATVMDMYATERNLSNRRLEARFEGESGFDAASGDEAGVTRGFYADVAEALLSAENVAGVNCVPSCSVIPDVASIEKPTQMDIDLPAEEELKLPIFIPDMDSSSQVVIPTPRADPKSAPGVFPRPLPPYHPQMKNVATRFRLIGRLFAAAMRDNFLFPLPLSSAFLKLVCSISPKTTETAFKKSPDSSLSFLDLPRPGFIGGEVYAAAVHICRVLDEIDASQLSRHEQTNRYEEVANDKSFGRTALGKSFDLSFNDYFADRTFVDPLDPSQGEDAMPLGRDGHRTEVTIYNIREWVHLSKKFILHDGVLEQAKAFRDGVNDFFPAEYLSLFTPEELQRDVCGVGDSVDTWDEAAVRKLFKLDGGKGAAEALVAVAAIGGEGGAALSRRFAPGSPTISNLVQALLEASPKQRRQFLSFVTSVPIVTPGTIEVVPIVSPAGEFLPMRDPSCLPRANTCARRLYLPKFENYESFSRVLWTVVEQESRFKGFFEWRGS